MNISPRCSKCGAPADMIVRMAFYGTAGNPRPEKAREAYACSRCVNEVGDILIVETASIPGAKKLYVIPLARNLTPDLAAGLA